MQGSNKQALTPNSTKSSEQVSTQLSTLFSEGLLLPQAATSAIELIINKALALNNNKSTSFASINQKTLTLKLAEFSFPLSFTVNTVSSSTSIIVRTHVESSDCTITTSINTLKKLKANQSLTQLIKQDELDVNGDIKIAQQFANIVQSLAIDWQSELARHLGDVPTHKLLQFGNKITKSILATGKKIEADIGDYLVHEKRLVVTTSQITAFNQQAKDIANKVDTLSARIDKLFSTVADK
ncbi:SCP2 domain-containing protein [Colwellia psychrerythraea]|uniref:Ubiquinone biosynthesis accessory factor UbiJ n=1 Tax=Colwellia psychrerythraea TaxID=28229 RepID=A0A099L2Z3_COLPS|nr:SCP2 sterol-binding domain-containing protein [Colwellia psychrerythraea]KGJ97339.1 Sterol-binding domain protein [Colwellia psychrerythraea]